MSALKLGTQRDLGGEKSFGLRLAFLKILGDQAE